MAKARSPFYSGTYAGRDFEAADAASRIERVQRFDANKCRAALRVKGLQKTVRDAIRRRQRQLANIERSKAEP